MAVIFLATFIGSLAFVMIVPGVMKRAHVRRQNRLLERCRALYILAVEAVGFGDDAAARTYLKRIRRMEQRWRFGNSWPYRLAFALWAIGVGAAGYVLVRVGAIILFGHARLPNADDARTIVEPAPVFLFLAGFGMLHATGSFFTAWTDWWLVDDCGDRLERILNAGRQVAVVTEEDEWRRFGDGLTPQQIFGLDLTFTRRQLAIARRRLVPSYTLIAGTLRHPRSAGRARKHSGASMQPMISFARLRHELRPWQSEKRGVFVDDDARSPGAARLAQGAGIDRPHRHGNPRKRVHHRAGAAGVP